MPSRLSLASLTALALSAATASAEVPASAKAICGKMIADGRGGAFTLDQCICMHGIASQTLDSDISGLLFDSWFNGTDNMPQLKALPRQGRVERQLKAMATAARKTCGVS